MIKEADEQKALIQWAQYNPILREYLMAIPNGGTRHKAEAASLKRQGVRPGVPDLFLAYPRGPYHGLWVELKRSKPYYSKLSDLQAQWIKKLREAGYEARVAYGFLEAKQILTQYLGKPAWKMVNEEKGEYQTDRDARIQKAMKEANVELDWDPIAQKLYILEKK